MTDPTRSNSGQLTLSLWLASKLQQSPLSSSALSSPKAQALVRLVRQSVFQPARSSDILLQEFIAKGANDGDLAVDYESVALYRWASLKSLSLSPTEFMRSLQLPKLSRRLQSFNALQMSLPRKRPSNLLILCFSPHSRRFLFDLDFGQ